MSHSMIVFVICRLYFSALSFAGFGRQAIVKNSLPALEKRPGAGRYITDNKSIIDDDLGSIAIFSLRFPVRQGKFGYASFPARLARQGRKLSRRRLRKYRRNPAASDIPASYGRRRVCQRFARSA